MKFLIFIKQVPEIADIRFHRETKTLVREGVRNIINAYDRRAISEAVRYRNENNGEVVVVTMGPPQASEALREALIMGADRAIHIQDRRLAGSDTLVTSRVLAAAAKKIGFDILMCGQHSTDSETAQVPPEMSELLDVPCAVAVKKIEYRENIVRAHCETDEGTAMLDLPIPCVISTAERLIKPIKTKDANLSSIPADRIEHLGLQELNVDPETVGGKASPTWVAEIYQETISRKPEMWNHSEPALVAKRILEELRNQSQESQETERVPLAASKDGRQYWCWVEHFEDRIRPVSLEILGSAATLAAQSGGTVCALMVGAPINTSETLILSSYGADKIFHATATVPHPDEIVALLCERIATLKPYAVLMPATSSGKYLAPRIAARLSLGLTGDCVGLKMDAEGRLAQLKPAFGGTIVAPIYSKTSPQFATIRPGALDLLHSRREIRIPVVEWVIPQNIRRRFTVVSQEVDSGVEASKMETAKVVVCVGMGLGQENVPLAFRLAELLGGAVGATRRVVDNGWLPRQFQIGLTGKFIAPELYLGLGVSGRYNHTIGIRKAGRIVAVNTDPNAEIFQQCDVGILDDCAHVVRQWIRTLEQSQKPYPASSSER